MFFDNMNNSPGLVKERGDKNMIFRTQEELNAYIKNKSTTLTQEQINEFKNKTRNIFAVDRAEIAKILNINDTTKNKRCLYQVTKQLEKMQLIKRIARNIYQIIK